MSITEKINIKTEIIVPFHDVDSVGVVWHGRYAKYLEVARCELLDSFNYSYEAMQRSGYVWPIVDMRIKYIRPLKNAQKISIQSIVEEWEFRLKIAYRITDIVSNEVVTKAYTIQVACVNETGEMLYETPSVFRQALGVE